MAGIVQRMQPLALGSLALVLLGGALAHAYLEHADPAPWSVVTEVPEVIELHFTEPIEVRFSTLMVIALELPSEALPDDLANLSEPERQRLNALAAQRVERALDGSDDHGRVDTGVLNDTRTAATVTLGLQDELPAGVYVVVWEVLSIDTHWTKDHHLFVLAPVGG